MAVTGILSKRLGSSYRSGRSPDWVKVKNPAAPGGAARGGGRLREEMTMNGRDLFAKVDRQVSELKERIAQQREVIKRAKLRGHSTAAAETIQRTLHQSLRAFEQRRQQVFEKLEAKQRPTVKREAEEDWG
jgi:phage gpG-like protein